MIHIGVTMRPARGVPRFSPCSVEDLGGQAFDGGNARLDLRGMRFDRACG